MVQGLDKKIKFMRGRNVSCTMVGGQGTKLHFVNDLEGNFCMVGGGRTENEIIFRDRSRCNITDEWWRDRKRIVVSLRA
jgi:hypothetical protein